MGWGKRAKFTGEEDGTGGRGARAVSRTQTPGILKKKTNTSLGGKKEENRKRSVFWGQKKKENAIIVKERPDNRKEL